MTPDFVNGDTSYNASDPKFVTHMQSIVPDLERLDNKACIQAYAHNLVDNRRNLLLVSSNTSDSSLLRGFDYQFADAIVPGFKYQPYSW